MSESQESARKNEKVLFISDEHIAGKTSNFAAYQASIIELIHTKQYKHICMLGDDWELFNVDKEHVKAMSNLLEILTGRSSRKWQKDFDKKARRNSGEKYQAAESVIRGSKWFIREFLDAFPDVHIHKVEGNHEKIERYRNMLDELQKDYPKQFEWSTHGLRLGDALLTHGHIPMQPIGSPDDTARLRYFSDKFANYPLLVNIYAGIEHRAEEKEWDTPEKTKAKLQAIEANLRQRTVDGSFAMSHHGGNSKLLVDLDWVKHLFFGHTHIRIPKFQTEKGGIIFHNTSAIVKGKTSRTPDDLGLLEGELTPEGKIINVELVRGLKKEPFDSWRRPLNTPWITR